MTNGYDIQNGFFDLVKANPCRLKPAHIGLYYYIQYICNKVNWAVQFQLPTTHTMHVLGIANHSTYYKLLEDLEKFGAIKLLEKGRNQHEAPLVALVIFTKATTKHTSSIAEADIQADSNHCIHNQTILTNKPNKPLNSVSTEKKAHTPKPLKHYNDFDRTKYTEDQANRFDLFNQYIDDKCPNLRKIKKQITIDTFLEFATEPKLKTVFLKCLNDLDNKPKFIEGKDRYLDLNKAIRNWVQNEIIRQSK